MNFEKRVLPLAGMVQAVHLVIGAAKNGMVAQDSIDKTLAPIFVQNPGSIAEVYAGTKNVSLGLHLVQEMLMEFRSDTHGELIKYCLAVINLEKSLSSSHEKMSALGGLRSRESRLNQTRRILYRNSQKSMSRSSAELSREFVSRAIEAIYRILPTCSELGRYYYRRFDRQYSGIRWADGAGNCCFKEAATKPPYRTIFKFLQTLTDYISSKT